MNGNKVKELRKGKGLSQEELAKIVGVERTYISKIENGKYRPSIALLERIAAELGCSLRDFF